MALNISVQFKDHYGKPSTPGLALNYTASEAFRQATEHGLTRNLRLYGDKSNNAKGGGETLPAIGPKYVIKYDAANNVKSAWNPALLANSAYFEQLSAPFRAACPGVHYLYAGNADARFASLYMLAKNRAFSWRFYLQKPPKANTRHIIAHQWGTGDAAWRLEAIEGKWQVCQLKSTWSQSVQDTLDALREIATPSSTQTTDIDTQSDALYEKVTEIDLGIDAENLYNRDVEIVVICERRGRMHIEVTGAGSATVENAKLLATGVAGTMWNAAPHMISVNRGAFYWQIGTVWFLNNARLQLPKFRWFYVNAISSLGMVHNGQSDAPTGTAIAHQINEDNPLWPYLYVDLTSNGIDPAFIYTIGSFVAGGERSGTDEVYLDTGDYNGNPLFCIEEFKPSCEGEERQFSVEMTLANPYNVLDLDEGGLDLHDRMADIYVNGALYAGNMMVREVTVGPLSAAHQQNLTAKLLAYVARIPGFAYAANLLAPLLKPDTKIELTFIDLESQAQNDLMVDDPVLDDMFLSDALRVVIKGGGAKDAEITGIAAGIGPKLDKAALGASPSVRPERESPRGDFLKYLMENWGMNYDLTTISGGWELIDLTAQPVIVLDPDKVENLELSRNYGETKNVVSLEGANDLVSTYTVQEGISPASPAWRGYLGRIARCATTRDEGRRTLASVTSGSRAQGRKKAKPGNFAGFTYPFQANILPRAKVSLHGVVYDVEQIAPDDQIKVQKMKVTAREVIALP